MEGIELKNHLKIIKVLALNFLLFVSVGIVAAEDSDDTHTVSVTIEQLSANEVGGEPIENTYFKEVESNESTDVQVNGEICGDEALIDTNMGPMTENEDDTPITESSDFVAVPDFDIGESTPEEISQEISIWISSMIDDIDLHPTICDFPDIAGRINIK